MPVNARGTHVMQSSVPIHCHTCRGFVLVTESKLIFFATHAMLWFHGVLRFLTGNELLLLRRINKSLCHSISMDDTLWRNTCQYELDLHALPKKIKLCDTASLWMLEYVECMKPKTMVQKEWHKILNVSQLESSPSNSQENMAKVESTYPRDFLEHVSRLSEPFTWNKLVFLPLLEIAPLQSKYASLVQHWLFTTRGDWLLFARQGHNDLFCLCIQQQSSHYNCISHVTVYDYGTASERADERMLCTGIGNFLELVRGAMEAQFETVLEYFDSIAAPQQSQCMSQQSW